MPPITPAEANQLTAAQTTQADDLVNFINGAIAAQGQPGKRLFVVSFNNEPGASDPKVQAEIQSRYAGAGWEHVDVVSLPSFGASILLCNAN